MTLTHDSATITETPKPPQVQKRAKNAPVKIAEVIPAPLHLNSALLDAHDYSLPVQRVPVDRQPIQRQSDPARSVSIQRKGASTATPSKGYKAQKDGTVKGVTAGVSVVIAPDQVGDGDKTETHLELTYGEIKYSTKDGVISSFTTTPPRLVITTVYGKDENPDAPSAYGRGTTDADKKAGHTSLRFHEGQHGTFAINYLSANPLPVFKGKKGMKEEDFTALMDTYYQQFSEYDAQLQAANVAGVDNVGTPRDTPAPAAAPAAPTPAPAPDRTVQKKTDGDTAPHEEPLDLSAHIVARRGGGHALPQPVQRHLERGLQSNLSRVRIHTDPQADQLSRQVNALAFTSGQDIYFRQGQYNPATHGGMELLAHEVTHTVQQSQGKVGAGIDPDPGLEAEAQSSGARLAQIQSPMPSIPHVNGPHAPGVYTPQAALQRAQDGAAHAFSLKPLYDLQPETVQRAAAGGLTIQRGWFSDAVDWVADKAADAINAVKNFGLNIVRGIPGYRELSAVLGKDLVTGEAMEKNPNAIFEALWDWLPGPLKDILKALKETNVIGKAWTWFKGEFGKLNLGGIFSDLASAAKNLSVSQATDAIKSRVVGIKNLISGSIEHILDIGLTVLSAGLGPLGQQVMGMLRRSKTVILDVIKNPIRFIKNVVSAVTSGFRNFASNVGHHLKEGFVSWLTGASGIKFPQKFDLEGVLMTALTVMGLTYQNFRGRLVKALGENGEKKIEQAEKTVDVVQKIAGGLHQAEDMKAEQSNVGGEVSSGVKNEVTTGLVQAGIQKIAALVVPGGGIISAIMGGFSVIQGFIANGQRIMGIVMTALSSVEEIVAGNIGKAAGFIETTLANAIPVALDFFARFMRIGNFGEKIKKVITKVQSKVNGILDNITMKIRGIINKILSALGGGKSDEKVKNDALSTSEKREKLEIIAARIREKWPEISQAKEESLAPLLKNMRDEYGLAGLEFSSEGDKRILNARLNPVKKIGELEILHLDYRTLKKELWGSNGRPSWMDRGKIDGNIGHFKGMGHHRRHIEAWDKIFENYVRKLDRRTFVSAQVYLKEVTGITAELNYKSLMAVFKKKMEEENSDDNNLWSGPGEENSLLGSQSHHETVKAEELSAAGDHASAEAHRKNSVSLKNDPPQQLSPTVMPASRLEKYESDLDFLLSFFSKVQQEVSGLNRKKLTSEGEKLKIDHEARKSAEYETGMRCLNTVRMIFYSAKSLSKTEAGRFLQIRGGKIHEFMNKLMSFEDEMTKLLYP